LAGAEDVLLADHVVQRLRPHAFGQWRGFHQNDVPIKKQSTPVLPGWRRVVTVLTFAAGTGRRSHCRYWKTSAPLGIVNLNWLAGIGGFRSKLSNVSSDTWPNESRNSIAAGTPFFMPMPMRSNVVSLAFGTTSSHSMPSLVSPSFRDRKSTRLNSSHVKISYA